MFDQNGLEKMLARLRSKSDAGMFWHVFALAQHGKRPCACLIRKGAVSDPGMFWHVALWPNMGRGLVHV